MWVYRMSSGHLIIPQSPFSGPPTLYTGGQSPKGHGGETCNLILLLIYVRSKISQAFITALMRPTICRLYEKSSVHNQFTWAVLDQIIKRWQTPNSLSTTQKPCQEALDLLYRSTWQKGRAPAYSQAMWCMGLSWDIKERSSPVAIATREDETFPRSKSHIKMKHWKSAKIFQYPKASDLFQLQLH